MCLNCGCGQYWDDLGIPDNITMQKVEKASKANGMKVEDSLKEMLKAIPEVQKQMEQKKK
jgi:soluble cytochrome b562